MRRRSPSGPPRLHLAALLLSLALPALAAQAPMLTFVEGSSVLLSGGRAYLPAPGVRLRACDALSTGPGAMVQVEYEDGSAVLLGPDSRFVFELPGAGAEAVGPQYLHSGWAKITAVGGANAAPQRIGAPHFDLAIGAGVAVLHMAADGGQVYVESGHANVLLPAAGAPVSTAVGTGYTFVRQAQQGRGSLSRGVDPAFAKALPRTLRDSLPPLLAQLKARDVKPGPAPQNAQGDDAWLAGVPELRACGSDDKVRMAQAALARKGYDVGPIDGVPGPRTQTALRLFQQLSGLPPTGALDAQTLNALEAAGGR
jgi:hypothetical protein